MGCALDGGGADQHWWWDGPDRHQNVNRNVISKTQTEILFHIIEVLIGGTGIDIGSAGMTHRNTTLNLDINYHGGRIDIFGRGEMLPIKNECMNYIFSSHSLEHIPNTEDTLKEWLRILKHGGIIAIVIPDKKYFTHDVNVIKDGEIARHEYTPEEIFLVIQKLKGINILSFNTRNNNFDFDILIRKE